MRAREHEVAFRQLYDTANKILEATYNDEETARKAISALLLAQVGLERRIGEMVRDVTVRIDSSASAKAKRRPNS